jgi:hypothetical protein
MHECQPVGAKDVVNLLGLARALEKQWRLAEVVDCYQGVLQLEPTNAVALAELQRLRQK